MPSPVKTTLHPSEFGRQLIETNDLDPIYVMLWEAKLENDLLKRWLLAYWCFYHAGTSSWIVDQSNYWQAFMVAASTKEHPRSAERRHFRGANAIKSTEYLRGVGVETLFNRLADNSHSLLSITKYVKREWVGFGDWIAFKIADMLERLGLAQVAFSPLDIFNMFEAPREGAELMFERFGGGVTTSKPHIWSYNQLIARLGRMKAPPRYERNINIQEIETILCKWKSHMNGHYEVGKDKREICHGLQGYLHCPTAERLYRAGGKATLWATF